METVVEKHDPPHLRRATHYCVVDDFNILKIHGCNTDFIKISRNSEAFTSEFQENLEEMFSRYLYSKNCIMNK